MQRKGFLEILGHRDFFDPGYPGKNFFELCQKVPPKKANKPIR